MLRLLVRFLRPYRSRIGAVIALVLFHAVANLYLPDLNADIINNGVAKGDLDHILATGGVMLIVALALAVVAVASVYLASQVSMAFGRDVRAAVFHHVGRFAQTEMHQFGTPSLITRNTNDVQQVQQVVMMALTMMIGAPLMLVGGVVMALRMDAHASGVLAVVLPLMGLFIGVALAHAMPLFRAMQVKLDRINQVVRETLAGVRVIRAFVRHEFEAERFREANVDLMDTALRVNRIFAILIPVLFGTLNLTTVAVIWFGGHRIASGVMPIGNLTALLTYIVQILMSVMMATMMFAMVPRAAASAERIQEVLETGPSVQDPPLPIAAPAPRGRLEFRNVEFRYPAAEDAVLRDISFSTGAGEVTAIIGSTGSGKSTLVNLIPRFFDATAGEVLLDGVDIRRVRLDDVWGRIGFVPQRAFLFAGTIASNLRDGRPDATDTELWAALDTAQASEFVAQMPGGLEAPVTQGGANLSGGQRQRLAIARALVKRAPILVFDDSFSALDFATDARLRAALRRDTRDAAVIIVAQRVATVLTADRIIVLDGGRVVGIGTHSELMASNETYREIVNSQLTRGEAA